MTAVLNHYFNNCTQQYIYIYIYIFIFKHKNNNLLDSNYVSAAKFNSPLSYLFGLYTIY